MKNRNVNDTNTDAQKHKKLFIVLDNESGKPIGRETPFSQTFFVYLARHWAEKFAAKNNGHVYSIQGLARKGGYDMECEGSHRDVVRAGYTQNFRKAA
jgi:hypothetical protein